MSMSDGARARAASRCAAPPVANPLREYARREEQEKEQEEDGTGGPRAGTPRDDAGSQKPTDASAGNGESGAGTAAPTERYPIGWRGTAGWPQELQRRGGEDVVGVRVTEAPPDDADRGSAGSGAGGNTDTQQSASARPSAAAGGGSNGRARRFLRVVFATPERAALFALGAALLATASFDLAPFSAVAYVNSAAPLARGARTHPSVRRVLDDATEWVSAYENGMRPRRGTLVLHALFGPVSVIFAALEHLQRTRALLFLAVAAVYAARAAVYVFARTNAARHVRAFFRRTREQLRDGPSFWRGLRFLIPPERGGARVLLDALVLAAAACVPLAFFWAADRWFPETALWMRAGVPAQLLTASIAGMATCVLIATHALIATREYDAGADVDADADARAHADLLLDSVRLAAFVVVAGYVITALLAPSVTRARNGRELFQRARTHYAAEVGPNPGTKRETSSSDIERTS